MVKRTDLAIVLLFPLFIFILVFFFNLKINYFESLILILGIPSLYLSIKNKNKVKKVAVYTVLMGLPVAIIFELLGFGDKAWVVPQSILSYRLFGFSPLENYIWMFICPYIIIMFYEHFCNNKFQPEISKKIRLMIYILYPLTAFIIILFILNSPLLNIPYAYLWLCLIFWLTPITLFLTKYPRYTASFFYVSIFFFYIHMIFELVGLKLHHWLYQGTHYLGWISFVGLSFPIEEFFFVILWGGFAALVYYEFFTNKELK